VALNRTDVSKVDRGDARGIERSVGDEAAPSVLSAGAVLQGSITSPGPVHVQGSIEGEIRAPRVTLGEGGRMAGKLRCDSLVIEGAFEGDLKCEDAIAGNASVIDGSIECRTLQAAPGAQIIGALRIGTEEH
jgi:cytoskeletal protein CcmA (bactofilin family)